MPWPAAAGMLMRMIVVCTGCVLVTFKSRFSVPPYRIENRTTDVVVYFAQSSLKATRENWNWLSPLPGGSAMAYAWDEPTYDHRLQVQVSLTLVTFALACLLTRSLVAAPDRWSEVLRLLAAGARAEPRRAALCGDLRAGQAGRQGAAEPAVRHQDLQRQQHAGEGAHPAARLQRAQQPQGARRVRPRLRVFQKGAPSSPVPPWPQGTPAPLRRCLRRHTSLLPKLLDRLSHLALQGPDSAGLVCQVYVTVFADGPTRVLRFSDEPSAVTVEAEQSILDLAARLKQVR